MCVYVKYNTDRLPFIIFVFRNLNKKFALNWLHVACLVFKILNDCVGKSLLGFCFIYSVGHGKFSTLLTLGTFYSITAIMMLFHAVFSNAPTSELRSLRHWIGEKILD